MDMIFKTESYTEIEKTLCEYFDISKPVLEKTAIQYINDYDKLTNVTITSLYDWFVAKFPTDNHITQVEFYHLTRRLKTSTGDYSIQNLQTLLISNKNFTDFLNKYDISFAKKGESINLLYKNKLFNFDDEHVISRLRSYFKSRLDADEEQDSFINGFAFFVGIEKIKYYESLQSAPEIINRLADLFDNNDIVKDYERNSYYHCFKYIIPIERITLLAFKNRNVEKTLLSCAISILAKYYIDECLALEHDLILRLPADYNLDAKYFVCDKLIY